MILLSTLIIACAVGQPLATAPAAPAQPPAADAPPKDRVAAWREDLAMVVDQLPKLHKNAFATVTKEQWTAAAESLDKKLPGLTDRQTYLELTRLIAMIGDAHTTLGPSAAFHERQLPVLAARLSDGIFVIASDEAHKHMLGSRILAVGGVPVNEVLTRMAPLVSADNEVWRTRQSMPLLTQADPLEWAGVPHEGDKFTFDLAADNGGPPKSVTVTPGAKITVVKPSYRSNTLIVTRRGHADWFNFELLANSRDLYAWYEKCMDQPGRRTVAQFCDSLLAAIDKEKPERLILDLRRNAGGNSALLGPLVNAIIKREDLRRPGFLFVLIGPTTFSSGMMNALQLKRAGAVLVGGPTGQKPNSFGEVKSFQLPNSQLRVSYSTKYFRQIADADPPSLMPDVPADPSSREYFDETRDTAIEAVRNYKP